MHYIQIRLKRFPSLYIGKYSPTYAMKPDKRITADMNRGRSFETVMQLDHRFTQREKAKVWTSEIAVSNFIQRCNNSWNQFTLLPTTVIDNSGSFNEYEVVVTTVINGKAQETIREANSYLRATTRRTK